MRYRSIPAEIEAVLYDRSNSAEVKAFVGLTPRSDEPAFLLPYEISGLATRPCLWVEKSRRWVGIDAPYWIVREPDGTGFYPCDPVIFAQRWEPIPEPEPAPSKECRGFAWIGQDLDHCDRCDQPWYAHEGMERLATGPFAETVLFEITPWTGNRLERHEAWKREQAKETGK